MVVALDADPSGNDPRTVSTIEQCLSAAVNQTVDIDVVIPSPGIPSERGIAAYQFSLFYDPNIVWISADDPEQLLAQAAGSTILPIADPKPDSNGIYQSGAADFGPKGIEPEGASETGPGVISRITLLPRAAGLSPLVLKDVLILDDASQTISVDSVQSGTIFVGEPCPGQSETATPSPPVVTPTAPVATPTAPPPTPTASVATPAPPATTPTVPASGPTPPAATPTLVSLPASGAAPISGSGGSWWLLVSGLGASLGGAFLFMTSKRAICGQSRWRRPSRNNWRE